MRVPAAESGRGFGGSGLIRVERLTADGVLEAQEFRTATPIFETEADGTVTLHFRSDEGHPSLTVMLDPSAPEGAVLREALGS